MYGCAHCRGHFEPGAVNSKLVSAPCDKVAAWRSAIRRRDRALPRVAKARRPARGRERAFELTLNPCAPTCLGARRWPCKSGPWLLAELVGEVVGVMLDEGPWLTLAAGAPGPCIWRRGGPALVSLPSRFGVTPALVSLPSRP